MQALLTCFTKLTIGLDGEESAMEKGRGLAIPQRETQTSSNDMDKFRSLRLSLCNGLMRAFVAQNSQRKSRVPKDRHTSRLDGALSTNLSSHSQTDQELIVSRMLDL
jgi:hypothetical protein